MMSIKLILDIWVHVKTSTGKELGQIDHQFLLYDGEIVVGLRIFWGKEPLIIKKKKVCEIFKGRL